MPAEEGFIQNAVSTQSQETVQSNDALSLKSWTWAEHGYRKCNANEALQLFIEKGLVQIERTHITGNKNGQFKVEKLVTVPSIGISSVPIQGTGVTKEDAECKCNLMIIAELYRCEIVSSAENELQQLPTDVQHRIRTKMGKFNVPMGIFSPRTSSPSSSNPVELPNPNTPGPSNSFTTTNDLSLSTIKGHAFLRGIESECNRNGMRNNNNGDNNERYMNANRFHLDVNRRKFPAQMKSADELFREQRQMNHGPVRQANIPVRVTGDGAPLAIRTFDDIQLTPEIRSTLRAINYFEPTNLQKHLIPLVQQTDNDILCLAATGSGKSGAFLIPIVHRLQGFRTWPHGEVKPVNKNAPFAIITTHTKELVGQLFDKARILALKTGVGVAIARGQMPLADIRAQLNNGCDILVITPGKLRQFVEEKWIQLHNIQFVVIDEADKLIMEDDMLNVIHNLRTAIIQENNVHFRMLMFSATFSEMAESSAKDLLKPGYYEVQTAGVNHVVAHIPQQILPVDRVKCGRFNPRQKMLLSLLRHLSDVTCPCRGEHFCYDTKKTIVFVNEGRRADRVAIALSDWGFRAMSTNGHRSLEQRHNAYKEFREGKWHILVATDIISRGLNMPNVENVIIYEMPPVDRYQQYIHRVGRIGRIGMDIGQAYVFFDPRLPNDIALTQFLVDQLRLSNQQVPGFLERLEWVKMLVANER